MKVSKRYRSLLISACLTVTVLSLLGSFYKTIGPTRTSSTFGSVMSSFNRSKYEISFNRFVDSWINKNYLNLRQFQTPANASSSSSSMPPIFDRDSILIDRRVAQEVSEKIRVFCWLPTREVHRNHRMKAVNETWARRCDKVMYFMTSPKNKSHDLIDVPIVDSRKTLTDKTVYVHNFIYDNYLHEYDWFLKADDDTYVIMENLKFLLSKFDLETPGYVGCQFKHFAPQGYMSGGASYAFNSLGIKAIVEEGYRIPGRCRLSGGAEDIETGRCAYKAGVRTLNQFDAMGKQTFFPSNVYANVLGPIPGWVASYTRGDTQAGLSCCSPLLVTFHYTGEKLMYAIDFLLYRVVVHGRREIISKSESMFEGKEAADMELKERRRPYPGETLEEYYKPGWREKNTTIYINPSAK